MDDKKFTNELRNVISYMVDVLGNEFPCSAFTPEYAVMSILDTRNCNANMILDKWLTTIVMKDLRNIYSEFLTQSSLGYVPQKEGPTVFNGELSRIFVNAEIEKNNLDASQLVGSEHVLLAMLNPSNGVDKIQNVFKNCGITYIIVRERCFERYGKQHNKKNKNQVSNEGNFDPFAMFASNMGIGQNQKKQSYIKSFTTNLTDLARENLLGKLVGREKELEVVMKILSRKRKNNVAIVGDGGVGKTSIVNGLAYRIVQGDVPEVLRNKQIVQLNVMSLVGGTHFRGMMEERVNGLFEELKRSNNYILVFDDMQQMLKTSSKEKDSDLSPFISGILAEGFVSIIGTLGFKDYRNGIEGNPSLSRKIQKVVIEPSSKAETKEILLDIKKEYEEYHNVTFTDSVIDKTIELSSRYLTDRSLPDSAIDTLDLVGAYISSTRNVPQEVYDARKKLSEILAKKKEAMSVGNFELAESCRVDEVEAKKVISSYSRKVDSEGTGEPIVANDEDVARVISDITSIPINKLNEDDKAKIASIDKILKKNIVGQDEAIDSVCKIIKRNKVGLGNKNRPLGVCMLIGRSGTGKSMLAKQLAKQIFGSENDLIRIDMSEYSEKASVTKLIGSAPGYVGYENGGQLTERVKNKQHCVILFDEIEKADEEVYNLFLQMFDEGRLTDSSGQLVNFKNTIILMTSNVGAKRASEFSRSASFFSDTQSNTKSITEKELKKCFSPEFLNRIDQVIYFNTLSDEDLKKIVVLELERFSERLAEAEYNVEWDDSVVDELHRRALETKEYGARPIIHLIQDCIEDLITNTILEGEYEKWHTFSLTFKDNEFKTL